MSENLQEERKKALAHLIQGGVVLVKGPNGTAGCSLFGKASERTEANAQKTLAEFEEKVGGATAYELWNSI